MFLDDFFCIQVTGEANFAISGTCLTIGGFTQPGVPRALIFLSYHQMQRKAFLISLYGYFQNQSLETSLPLGKLVRISSSTWVHITVLIIQFIAIQVLKARCLSELTLLVYMCLWLSYKTCFYYTHWYISFCTTSKTTFKPMEETWFTRHYCASERIPYSFW